MKRYKLKKVYLIPIIVLTALITFFIVFGTSYAFFTSRVTSKDYVITVGNLQIDYTKTGNVVNLTNTYPMTNTEGLATTGYNFNITNNGSINARYQIRLELDSNNTMPMEYIKLAYIKTMSNSSEVDEAVDSMLLSNLNATNTFIKNQIINPTKTDSYNLKLWIDYSAPNDIQGKTFRAKIVIDAIQNEDDGYVFNSTSPIITLNKFEDGNIDKHLLVNDQFIDPGILSVVDDKDLLTENDISRTVQYTSDGTNLSSVLDVDTTTSGVYYINYSVTDSSNNISTAVRVVTVNTSSEIPTISLNGNSSITIEQFSTFNDPGVTVANDNHVAVIGEVKTSIPDAYTIKYIVIDNNGKVNSVVRTVIVTQG